MSKLAIFIHQDRILPEGETVSLPSTFRDELNFSSRIGDPILVANIGAPLHQGFIALGMLQGFTSEGHETLALIGSIRNFPQVATFRQDNPAGAGMFEVSDATFTDVIGMVTGSEFDEAATEFWSGTWPDPG
ncbi:hypothetical protein [Devosia rhizoryzae]|uniref:Uncharacterized protein n=1 Tax=Devosia rhizoryzae TaxID=2774137 RepID=A0ABX7C5I1_9HYPH|nr:hypothetical protein [Devosia rhizoryzae]QQR39515.1 hypothetical protein JI748_00385 [Devosia rhizoryzae]